MASLPPLVEKTPLRRAFEILKGPSGVRAALAAEGIKLKSPWTCNKWLRAGRLPWTSNSWDYAAALERATEKAGEKISASELLKTNGLNSTAVTME